MLLITGGNGQVGKDLIRLLRKREIKHVFTSREDGPSSKNSSQIRIDLSIPSLDWATLSDQITGIIHLAAAVPHSKEFPDNMESALKTQTIDDNILNLQKITKVPMIYFSSCGLYSKAVDYFHVEENPQTLIPQTPYFAAKLRAETKIQEIPNAVIFRLSAPVSLEMKNDLVLARMLHNARTIGKISVYGNGTREQDFILTQDISNAIIDILQLEAFGTFNLCSSNPVSMLSLAHSLANLIPGTQISIGEEEDEKEGQRARYDNSKLQSAINWNPVARVDEILKTLVH
jgi:nucleoside-diphosphate-sugar epimerase